MKPSNLDLSLLVAIYELARGGEAAHVLSLAERVRQPAYVVLESTLRLEASGCLDAGRLRLTFRGLAVAEAERRAKGKSSSKKTMPRKAVKRSVNLQTSLEGAPIAGTSNTTPSDVDVSAGESLLIAEHFNALVGSRNLGSKAPAHLGAALESTALISTALISTALKGSVHKPRDLSKNRR
jgi:hypothetical protein